MDQDASNNPGKASWREKLGLGAGAKAMPKISNEFKGPRTNLNVEPQVEADAPAERSPAERKERAKPQPVARPAPMAPRPQAQAKSPSGSPLAERLRAQRQAAEKLAEQRILAARGAKVEPKPASGDKPKFTFAEEEIAQARREAPVEQRRDYQPPAFAAKPAAPNGAGKPSQPAPAAAAPPLVPPRPSLGGERSIAPQPAEGRPAPGPHFPPRYQQAAPQPAGYRPLDPPSYQARQQPASPPPRPASYGNGAYAEARGAPPRGYDAYRRRSIHDPAGEEPGHAARPRRARSLPARGRQSAYEDDFGDVFEEEAPTRRRASAQDYHQAYRDYDEAYDQGERRRSSGPWLVALALFVVAVLATGGWYYLYFMKPGQVTSAEIPVIAAPEKPAKTEPEAIQPSGSTLGTSGNQGALESPPERRKQIYDRVLGEEAVEGNQIVPTQEQPQQVEPAGDPPQQPGALPQPNVQGNSGAGTSQAIEPLPLPLPPPPGSAADQQGNLNAGTGEQTASLNSSGNQDQSIAQPVSTSDVIAPVPGEAEDAAKAVAETRPAAPPAKKVAEEPVPKVEAKPADQPPAAAAAEVAPVQAEEPAPTKPKARTAKTETKKKPAAAEVEQITDQPEPIVLVPPPGDGAVATQSAGLPEAQPEKRSGSFFKYSGKATGKRAEQGLSAGRNPEAAPPAVDNQQVATLEPESGAQPLPMPAPEAAQPKPQAGGYLAQLASFRSEAEALAEYDRLRGKYGSVVGGLPPRVTKASVSGSTRYRLGVGPVASREAAARICNSLIAAGERDCLVRGN